MSVFALKLYIFFGENKLSLRILDVSVARKVKQLEEHSVISILCGVPLYVLQKEHRRSGRKTNTEFNNNIEVGTLFLTRHYSDSLKLRNLHQSTPQDV